jgi:hypothetical protein
MIPTVEFVHSNGATRPADGIERVSAETLRLNLNLPNWPAIHVRAIEGADTVAGQRFEVVEGGIPISRRA